MKKETQEAIDQISDEALEKYLKERKEKKKLERLSDPNYVLNLIIKLINRNNELINEKIVTPIKNNKYPKDLEELRIE